MVEDGGVAGADSEVLERQEKTEEHAGAKVSAAARTM
jgi:hypothetical protein